MNVIERLYIHIYILICETETDSKGLCQLIIHNIRIAKLKLPQNWIQNTLPYNEESHFDANYVPNIGADVNTLIKISKSVKLLPTFIAALIYLLKSCNS